MFIIKSIFAIFKIMFQKNIFHTDLKPANIICLINKTAQKQNKFEYDIKLIDFGSATFNWEEVKALTKDYFVDI